MTKERLGPLRPGQKVFLVGFRAVNFPESIRNHSQIVIVDAEEVFATASTRQFDLPAHTEAVIIGKAIRHSQSFYLKERMREAGLTPVSRVNVNRAKWHLAQLLPDLAGNVPTLEDVEAEDSLDETLEALVAGHAELDAGNAWDEASRLSEFFRHTQNIECSAEDVLPHYLEAQEDWKAQFLRETEVVGLVDVPDMKPDAMQYIGGFISSSENVALAVSELVDHDKKASEAAKRLALQVLELQERVAELSGLEAETLRLREETADLRSREEAVRAQFRKLRKAFESSFAAVGKAIDFSLVESSGALQSPPAANGAVPEQ